MHEYYYIYWYLSEFLYAWLMSTLSRADGSQMAEERIMEEQQKGRSSKKTKKKEESSPIEPRDHNEPGISEHVCWNVQNHGSF